MPKNKHVAVFGGGCFWCTEAVFSMLKGVITVTPGYAGGDKTNPSYEDVCSGDTGHAEVVRVEYNPSVISYQDLLAVFFGSHNATTPNRQGADVGTQYRSIIFFTTEQQKKEAEDVIHDINAAQPENPVVTEVRPLEKFFGAEDSHRNYFAKNPAQGYCQMVIQPKVAKIKNTFSRLLKQSKNDAGV